MAVLAEGRLKMKWEEIRRHYPHEWVLVEAVNARSESGRRIVDELTLVDTFEDSRAAMRSYVRLHQQSPEREFFVLHTDREHIDVIERRWLGVRGVQ
jgi:hypothetical protein